MILAVYPVLVAIIGFVEAVPLAGRDDNTIVTYVSEPDGRGTISLLLSCLLTLVLCVWSALHLNIEARGVSYTRSFWLYARWIGVGVFGPELVAFTAWRQWCCARILTSIAQKELKNLTHKRLDNQIKTITTEGDKLQKWTMTHSFYTITGGFVLDCSNFHTKFLPEHCPKRITLTSHAMSLLLRCGVVPDIAENDIWDKSKANMLAKTLVLIQAAWMLLQVIGRLATNLPVTLLEINTCAHILCVFLIYLMWWKKPLSVTQPTVLTGPWAPSLCAYMFMCSQTSGKTKISTRKANTLAKTLFASMSLFSTGPEIEKLTYISSLARAADQDLSVSTLTKSPQIMIAPADVTVSSRTSDFRFARKQSLEDLQALKNQSSGTTAFFERRPRIQNDSTIEDIDDITQLRWRLAAEAIETYPVILEQHILAQTDGKFHFTPQEFLVSEAANWPQDDLLRNVDGLIVGMILWLASFVYGAIHASAWNAYFPTEAETWLWRASSLYVAFCGALWIILNGVARVWRRMDDFWNGWVEGKSSWWQYVLILPLVIICGSSFFLARGFLVLEAFISLRQQPEAAYETPDWTQLVPHF